MKALITALAIAVIACPGYAEVYYVSSNGDDGHPGTEARPFRTISAAASVAGPGDTITVHEGVYRERINPPRGGSSNAKRIIYQAAKGERVVIKGSETVKGWEQLQNDTWRVSIPNSLFGDFNPFDDLIRGDWFWSKDRDHHTGAVYLNGHWLVEARELDPVLAPFGVRIQGAEQNLLNVSWLQVAEGGKRIGANSFSAQSGIRITDCDEGGECIGQVEDGDWIQFDHVDFGNEGTTPGLTAGRIAGNCIGPSTRWATVVDHCGRQDQTGQWGQGALACVQSPAIGCFGWIMVCRGKRKRHDHLGTVQGRRSQRGRCRDQRSSVRFLSGDPGAPPTAEQIGLIGTHWSKGWVIEDNTVRYSVCTCVTLGKHGDEFDNTSANSSEGYVETIKRGLAAGWSRENIGGHIVRNNRISHCEQAGIVGSMGAAFSTITGNEIHDIHIRRLFTGAEMAGIKIHAPIDTLISNNHIHHVKRGIWLDWMTQGTRVTGNLLHDNATDTIRWQESWEAISPGGESDMFIEVNHGPFLIDNNIFLSPYSVNNRSQGVVFAHNIFAGAFRVVPHDSRQTPYHKAHSTEVVDLHDNPSGDNHYYNNIFVEHSDLSGYDTAELPVTMEGNVYLNGARPSKHETDPLIQPEFDPAFELMKRPDGWYLQVTADKAWADLDGPLVTSEILGKAIIPNLPYEQPDGTPYRLDTDHFGNERSSGSPYPGPFHELAEGTQTIKVWPRN
jgi:hypothetical protein